MAARLLVFASVEGLYDVIPVLRVDPQQRQEYEPQRATFVGRLRFDLLPHLLVDAADAVVGHVTSFRTKFQAAVQMVPIWAPAGHLGACGVLS